MKVSITHSDHSWIAKGEIGELDDDEGITFEKKFNPIKGVEQSITIHVSNFRYEKVSPVEEI